MEPGQSVSFKTPSLSHVRGNRRGKKSDDRVASYGARRVAHHAASSEDELDWQNGSDSSAVAPQNPAESLVGEDEAECSRQASRQHSRMKRRRYREADEFLAAAESERRRKEKNDEKALLKKSRRSDSSLISPIGEQHVDERMENESVTSAVEWSTSPVRQLAGTPPRPAAAQSAFERPKRHKMRQSRQPDKREKRALQKQKKESLAKKKKPEKRPRPAFGTLASSAVESPYLSGNRLTAAARLPTTCTAGLFHKGRVATFKSRGSLPDLSFSETEFLKDRSDAAAPQRAALQEKEKGNERTVAGSRGDISAYFKKVAPPPSGKENVDPQEGAKRNPAIPYRKRKFNEPAVQEKPSEHRGSESTPEAPAPKKKHTRRADRHKSTDTSSDSSASPQRKKTPGSGPNSRSKPSRRVRGGTSVGSLSVNYSSDPPGDMVGQWLSGITNERPGTPDDFQSVSAQKFSSEIGPPVVKHSQGLDQVGVRRAVSRNPASLARPSETYATRESTTNRAAGIVGTSVSKVGSYGDLHSQLSIGPEYSRRFGHGCHCDILRNDLIPIQEPADLAFVQGNSSGAGFQHDLVDAGSFYSRPSHPGPRFNHYHQTGITRAASYGAFSAPSLVQGNLEMPRYPQEGALYDDGEELFGGSLQDGHHDRLDNDSLLMDGSFSNNDEPVSTAEKHLDFYSGALEGRTAQDDDYLSAGHEDFVDLEAEFGGEQVSNMETPMDATAEDAGQYGQEVCQCGCMATAGSGQHAQDRFGRYAAVRGERALPPGLMSFQKPHWLY
ncbi:hypothetical protein TWF696_002511 [Orbilia brochopaga]|uniref:Uncharacterized protein n=1 Tax=Orbilia brochopaga TaxID=3140254 RepID=A0AAV9U642_9PEZI